MPIIKGTLVTKSTSGSSVLSTDSSSTSESGTNDPITTSNDPSAQDLTLSVAISPLSGFYQTPGISQTDVQMLRAGVGTAISAVMAFRGSVIGLALKGTANKTAGTLTASVFVDGVETAATLDMATSASVAQTQYARGTYPFVRGGQVDVRITTSGAYAPTTTIYEAILFLALDPSEAA